MTLFRSNNRKIIIIFYFTFVRCPRVEIHWKAKIHFCSEDHYYVVSQFGDLLFVILLYREDSTLILLLFKNVKFKTSKLLFLINCLCFVDAFRLLRFTLILHNIIVVSITQRRQISWTTQKRMTQRLESTNSFR